jgi:hypothetical protein
MQAQTCAADPECGACLACIEMSGDITSCIGMCDQMDPRTAAAGMCILNSCGMQCGLAG